MASRVNVLQQSDLIALRNVLNASTNSSFTENVWGKGQAVVSDIPLERGDSFLHKELEQEILRRFQAMRDNVNYSSSHPFPLNDNWWKHESDISLLHPNQNVGLSTMGKESVSTAPTQLPKILHSSRLLQPLIYDVTGKQDIQNANTNSLGIDFYDRNMSSPFNSYSEHSLGKSGHLPFIMPENNFYSQGLPSKYSSPIILPDNVTPCHAVRDSESESSPSIEHSAFCDSAMTQLVTKAQEIVKALTYDVEHTGSSSPKGAVVNILKTAMLLLGSSDVFQTRSAEKDCIKGVGGPNFSAPTMLAHPDEFKNPSSFLKIYGDPLCGQSPNVGGASPVKNQGGNWVCCNCSNINFPRRFRCNKCNEFRDSNGDEIVSEYAKIVYRHHLRSYRSITSKQGIETPNRRFNNNNQSSYSKNTPKQRVNDSRNINSFNLENPLSVNDCEYGTVNI
ncbi:Zn-finger in Ran binding protein and others domain-containing protein [Cardiosporidium cionae]|uniref:Zn-finger in Ran binding protein and others domain-containing protein n=1 Tax=Cardiosporidium cionae TaxID=476202 RepID=A0ABQ7J669_9APIC|nr:Zn-finger in Ran binding protein and others domain-containing protein [Cardiosporidium cionae]|eukprot:KAF8819500.1 Zn-finger in Ran binding protein and others domain-containing protein [Cardiosporidium cionae]